jgi:hypothetical protein
MTFPARLLAARPFVERLVAARLFQAVPSGTGSGPGTIA